jgi:hypothetical protein
MAKAKNWIFTDLSKDSALVLEMDGVTYKAASITMSFGLNGVPQAALALASGRDARTQEKAKIHDNADDLVQMIPAEVKLQIAGEFDASGREWPGGQVTIFEGYFMGWSMRKMMGKIQIVAELIHWLIDLSMSSSLSSLTHPSNPATLTRPAVTENGTGAGGKPVFIPQVVSKQAILKHLNSDLWGGMKEFMCGLTDFSGIRFQPFIGCTGTDIEKNDRGKKALARVEGPGGSCPGNLDHDLSKALALRLRGLGEVRTSIYLTLAQETISSFVNNTLWDVIIGQYFPMFGMDMVPLVDRALAIASLPVWRGEGGDDGYWRTIGSNEYIISNQKSNIPKPIRAVGIYTDTKSKYGAGTHKYPFVPSIGGCWGSDSKADGDGTLLLMQPPPWLKHITIAALDILSTTGLGKRKATTSETSGGSGTQSTGTSLDKIARTTSQLLGDFAKTQFANNALRGRLLEITGKLRFDIAPGSHVVVSGSSELFMAGVDVLAADMIGYVQTVTVTLDAESKNAYTSFRLSHPRSKAENKAERSSLEAHPLFSGEAMIKGAPLVREYEFK